MPTETLHSIKCTNSITSVGPRRARPDGEARGHLAVQAWWWYPNIVGQYAFVWI